MLVTCWVRRKGKLQTKEILTEENSSSTEGSKGFIDPTIKEGMGPRNKGKIETGDVREAKLGPRKATPRGCSMEEKGE